MMNKAKTLHPLLVRGAPVTDKTLTWTLKEYPYEVVGTAQGFEVRIYNFPAEGFLPYLIVEIALGDGWIMQTDATATETVARETAKKILEGIGTNVIQMKQ
jgi:hypothetical protein